MVKYSANLWPFFYHKYHFLEIFDSKTQQTRLKFFLKKLVPLLTLKCAIGLKTSYGEIFGKLWVFFLNKNTTFFRFLTLKHNNDIKIVKKKTSDAFNPKTRKWA